MHPQPYTSSRMVTYTPTQSIAAGRIDIYVEIANATRPVAAAAWSFMIEPVTTYDVAITSPATTASTTTTPPITATTVFTPKLLVTAQAKSNKVLVTEMTLNGEAMNPTSTTANAENIRTFSRMIDLVAGSNTLTGQATFADGQTRTTTTTVTYDAPPTISITSPADLSTLGPINPNSPRDLTGNVERPVTITGTISKPVASLTINQQQATLSGGQGGGQGAQSTQSFTFPNYFLREGTNLLTAVATDNQGRTATASLTVFVDQTAPILSIEAPANNAVTSANTIDIRGIVNDAVEGITNIPNPTITVVNASLGTTTTPLSAQTTIASVSDRYYLAQDIPLEVGANALTITATDHVGNSRSQTINVVRIAVGSNRITILSGNRQIAGLNVTLPKPLEIVAIDKQGNPLANLPISFDVMRGTGSISAMPTTTNTTATRLPTRNLVITTDAGGRAKVYLTLGKQAGIGGNMVRASNLNIGEDVIFTATADKGIPAVIRAADGVSQNATTNSPTMEALSAVVVDSQDNRIPNIPVTFTIEDGEAGFSDPANASNNTNPTITILTDKYGVAATRPVMGLTAGIVRISAKVASNATPSITNAITGATYQINVLPQQDGPTRFTGKVLDHTGIAIPGVRISIGRTNLAVTTDINGDFIFNDQVPPGRLDLFIDGRTAAPINNTNPNASGTPKQYPSLHFEALAIRGQLNTLPHPIYLPPLLISQTKVVGGNSDISLTIPGFEGFEMIVKANSVTFADGSKVGPLVVSPVLLDKLPMVPPGGYAGFMAPAWTIQPAGARFDPPIEVRIPNSINLKPGETREIYQWDHDIATFVPMGRATVSEDGALLVTDAGSGVTKAGWGGPPNPPPDPPKCAAGAAPICKSCKKLGSGDCPQCERDTGQNSQECSSDSGATCGLCLNGNYARDSLGTALVKLNTPTCCAGEKPKDHHCCVKPKTAIGYVQIKREATFLEAIKATGRTLFPEEFDEKSQFLGPPDSDKKGETAEIETENGVKHAVDGCSVPTNLQRAFPQGIFINKKIPSTSTYYNPLAESFYQGCRRHDWCYQTCGSKQGTCDTELKDYLFAECSNINPNLQGTRFYSIDIPSPYTLQILNFGLSLREECYVAARKVFEGLDAPIVGGAAAHLKRQHEMCIVCKK